MNSNPCVCETCNKTFSQTSSLLKHKRIHDGSKPFVCDFAECGRAFSQSSNLIRHRRIHTGERPYVCFYCSKDFASGSNLKQHLQIHATVSERTKYVCPVKVCHKSYLYTASLKKHVIQSHQDLGVEEQNRILDNISKMEVSPAPTPPSFLINNRGMGYRSASNFGNTNYIQQLPTSAYSFQTPTPVVTPQNSNYNMNTYIQQSPQFTPFDAPLPKNIQRTPSKIFKPGENEARFLFPVSLTKKNHIMGDPTEFIRFIGLNRELPEVQKPIPTSKIFEPEFVNLVRTIPMDNAHRHSKFCGHTGLFIDGQTYYLVEKELQKEKTELGKIDCYELAESKVFPSRCEKEFRLGAVKGQVCMLPMHNGVGTITISTKFDESLEDPEPILHSGHTDFLVKGVLHHPHIGHCDSHGVIALL